MIGRSQRAPDPLAKSQPPVNTAVSANRCQKIFHGSLALLTAGTGPIPALRLRLASASFATNAPNTELTGGSIIAGRSALGLEPQKHGRRNEANREALRLVLSAVLPALTNQP